jgi:hypothetical protein
MAPRMLSEDEFATQLRSDLEAVLQGRIARSEVPVSDDGYLRTTVPVEFVLVARASDDPTVPNAGCCTCYRVPGSDQPACVGDCCE